MSATAELNSADTAKLGSDVAERSNAVGGQKPIEWNDWLNGWLMTRHQDVMDGFLAKYPLFCVRMEARSTGAAETEQFAARYSLTVATLPFWTVNSNPPLHTRLRG